MPYLTQDSEILAFVAQSTKATTLWMDTEVADYQSRNPRLSLIQVLNDPTDLSGESIYLLDVLDNNHIITEFINQIMINPGIEKVFHNSSYDLKFLGSKKAKNITCTKEIAKKIPYYILPVRNYQLRTLAAQLCNYDIDKTEQTSDWGQRPLTPEQVDYAYLDCIYLAQVHLRLLELQKAINSDPATDNVAVLAAKYTQIEQQWKLLNSEYEHLKERIKKAMQTQNILEISDIKLSAYERKTLTVPFTELVNMVQNQGINLDFPITLTQKMQKDLGENLEKLPIDTERNTNWRLTSKTEENNDEE